MKKKLFTILMGSCVALLGAVLIVGNILGFKTYSSFLTTYFGMEGASVNNFTTNQYYPRELKSAEEASLKSQEICEQVEEEGAVLLTNYNDTLPLAKKSKVSLFSQSSIDFEIGSIGGSGAIADSNLTLQTALESVGIEVNPKLTQFYKDNYHERVVGGLASGHTSKDPMPWKINEVPISKYNDNIINSYNDYHDAAIIVLTRTGAENADLPTDMASHDNRHQRGEASILELDQDEKDLFKHVTEHFDKVIVLLNTTNTPECGFLEEYDIDACLWAGGAGQYGLNSVARLIVGDANPSGHLVDTYAYDVFSSPAMQNWGNFAFVQGQGNETGHHYVTYSEGIYVGYKYYETRYEDKVLNQGNAGNYNYDQTVQFPFGYGLSYTEFTWSDFVYSKDETNINISVKVKNTGDKPGKEVVQIYAQSPYTEYDKENLVEKSAVSLMAFDKTELLSPNDEETINISFPIERLKSYDDTYQHKDSDLVGSYILEKGDYYFTAAKDAHHAINNILRNKGISESKLSLSPSEELMETETFCQKDALDEIIYEKDTVTGETISNQFSDADGDKKYLSRNNWSMMDNNGLRDGTNPLNRFDSDGYIYETEISNELKNKLEQIGYAASGTPETEFSEPTFGANNHKTLISMLGKDFNNPDWDELLNQVRVKEMEQIVTSSGHKTYAIPSVNKPYATDTDGTSAWKSFIGDGVNAGGMPNETVQASTYNVDLEYEVGQIMGELALWAKVNSTAESTNLTGWYAPAMNLHRSPFGGRNFEYYSECPMLSGIIGSSVVKGATDKGVITYIKHFAFNEQETNRMTNNVTWAKEQALRETYLLPFEMSIKDGKSKGLMTAYPRVGTTWTGGSYALLTNVLRKEWGFNGFVITDYMDGDYENCDQMLAAGGDAALCLEEQAVTSEGAQALTYFRRAAHHLLYSFVNSNGMNGIDSSSVISGGVPVYYRYMIFFNITAGTLFLLSLGLMILGLFQMNKIKKLQTENSELTLNEANEKVKMPSKIKIVIIGVVTAIILSSGLIIFLTKEKNPTLSSSEYPLISNPIDPDTDLVAKYGTITREYLTKGSNENGMFFDNDNVGYYYEAEDAILSTKPTVEENLITSGGKFVSHFQVGETITFKIDSKVETSALVILSTARYASGETNIDDLLFGSFGQNENALDLYMDFGERTISYEQNWTSFREAYIAEVYLYEGINYIEFSAYQDVNLDYMGLVNVGGGLDLPPEEVDNTDYQAKYGNPQQGHLVDGSVSKEFSSKERGYYYEAESATLTSNIRIENNSDASGGKSISYFNPGEMMSFEINSDEDVTVMFKVSASEYNSADYLIKDSLLIKYGTSNDNLTEMKFGGKSIHTTGGWNNFSESIIGEIALKKGKNLIDIISKKSLNFDYISLINIWDGTPDPILPDEEEKETLPQNYFDEKYGSPTKNVLVDGTASMTFDDKNRGYYYEAEKAYLSDGISVSDVSSASNGQTIGHFQDGRYMEFTITSMVDSDAALILAGARWDKGEFEISSIINVTYGLENQTMEEMITCETPFSPIGNSWDLYKEYIGGEIHLKKGVNKIKIVSSSTAINYDYIALASPYNGEEENPNDFSQKYGTYSYQDYIDGTESLLFSNTNKGYFYEAESLNHTGDIQIEKAGEGVEASNGAFINRFRRNATMTLKITSDCETDALLTFKGASDKSSELNVSNFIKIQYGASLDALNDVDNQTLTFLGSGSWTIFNEFAAGEVHLKQGTNYIILTGIENSGINCDYIALVNPLDNK